eukprot:gene28551-35432_t
MQISDQFSVHLCPIRMSLVIIANTLFQPDNDLQHPCGHSPPKEQEHLYQQLSVIPFNKVPNQLLQYLAHVTALRKSSPSKQQDTSRHAAPIVTELPQSAILGASDSHSARAQFAALTPELSLLRSNLECYPTCSGVTRGSEAVLVAVEWVDGTTYRVSSGTDSRQAESVLRRVFEENVDRQGGAADHSPSRTVSVSSHHNEVEVSAWIDLHSLRQEGEEEVVECDTQFEVYHQLLERIESGGDLASRDDNRMISLTLQGDYFTIRSASCDNFRTPVRSQDNHSNNNYVNVVTPDTAQNSYSSLDLIIDTPHDVTLKSSDGDRYAAAINSSSEAGGRFRSEREYNLASIRAVFSDRTILEYKESEQVFTCLLPTGQELHYPLHSFAQKEGVFGASSGLKGRDSSDSPYSILYEQTRRLLAFRRLAVLRPHAREQQLEQTIHTHQTLLLSAMKEFRSQMLSRLQRGELTTEQASDLTTRHKQQLMQRIPQHMRHRMTQYTRVDPTSSPSPTQPVQQQPGVQSGVVGGVKIRHVNIVTPEQQAAQQPSQVAPSTMFRGVSTLGGVRGN